MLKTIAGGHRKAFILQSILCLLSLALLSSLVDATRVYNSEKYKENLVVEVLPEGKVFSDFVFESNFNHESLNSTSYRLLPKSLGEILNSFDVNSLILTFTNGRWNYMDWGFREISSQSGAQLAASFLTYDSTGEKWKKLTYAMAGLFCASLNFINEKNTVEPTISLGRLGNINKNPFRYAALPGEAVCTENLTPWTKLLPCTSKSGLATLLNAHKLFDSDYYSMSLSVDRKCSNEDCTSHHWKIIQRLSVVENVKRLSIHEEWTLSTLFGGNVDKLCPFADSTEISLIGEATHSPLEPATNVTNLFDRKVYHYDHKGFLGKSIGLRYPVGDFYRNDATVHYPCPLRMVRQLSGYGGIDGGILINIENHGALTIEATLFSMIPWYLTPYIHTLKTTVLGSEEKNTIKRAYYQAPLDRGRPASVELSLTIPPKTFITISLDFHKQLLQYSEYPPDANRGFDLSSTILTIESQSGDDFYLEGESLYSTSHLITMPTPDFSMPYNVITLTCTIVALFFGSAVNMLARNIVPIVISKTSKI